MNYIINFELCAVVVYGVISIFYMFKKKLPLTTNKLFIALLVSCSISAIANIATVLLPTGVSSLAYAVLLWGVNILFLATHNASIFIFTLYCVALVHSQIFHLLKPWVKGLIILPFCLEAFLIITSPFTKLIFYLDSELNYHHGPLFVLLYVIAMLYVLVIFSMVVKYQYIINTLFFRCLMCCIITVGTVLIVQLMQPSILIEDFMFSMMLLTILSTIQNPNHVYNDTTGVFNRTIFDKSVKQILQRNDEVDVVFVHLEDIQSLTATCSVEATDNILRSIGRFIEELAPYSVFSVKTNLMAVMISRADRNRSTESIISAIRSRFLDTWSIENLKVKLFVRFCVVSIPSDASSSEDLYKYADYITSSTQWTKDTIITADIDLGDEERYLAVKDAITKALKNDGFSIYYQPIYSLKTKTFSSAEALIRLFDDQLGFIPPDEFIPVAEECGYIIEVGDFVLDAVCRFISENHLRKTGVDYIEVNLSVIQCMQENLSEKVMSVLDKYQVPPEMINLEITETAAAGFPVILSDNVNHLVKNGVTFSMDDFGTGYSNMLTLVNLPFIIIKIDKSVIWSAFKTDKARSALQGMLSMINEMQLSSVAEGIETEEMVNELTSMGCSYLQGYYFSKPLPALEYLEFVRTHSVPSDSHSH